MAEEETGGPEAGSHHGLIQAAETKPCQIDVTLYGTSILVSGETHLLSNHHEQNYCICQFYNVPAEERLLSFIHLLVINHIHTSINTSHLLRNDGHCDSMWWLYRAAAGARYFFGQMHCNKKTSNCKCPDEKRRPAERRQLIATTACLVTKTRCENLPLLFWKTRNLIIKKQDLIDRIILCFLFPLPVPLQ